ncbi:MAG: peptidoglycan DD-metalloendopeptidase family protein [Synergistaceae bacterium]
MFKNRIGKHILLIEVLLVILISFIVFISSFVADKNGGHWALSKIEVKKMADHSSYVMIDVSNILMLSSVADDDDCDIVSISTGILPSIANLTQEELKLYSVLSKRDGLITSTDKDYLDEDIHWQEYVLEENDTIESIAERFGLKPNTIINSNLLTKKEKLLPGEVIYVPDSDFYANITRNFVLKMQEKEKEEDSRTKVLSVKRHVIKQGDSLWSIANENNLDVDTIVGSNNLNDINVLKLGTVLRIPNQDGVFIKITKRASLSKLADVYGSSLNSIKVANRINNLSTIRVGQEIFFPGGRIVDVSTPIKTRSAIVRKTTKHFFVGSSIRFGWPTAGKISSSFGWRRSPFGGRRRRFHSGLDIRAPRGRSIVAASSGRVVHSGWMGGYGKTVVVLHPSGVSTLYGHCSTLLVRQGAVVGKGQLIARIGSTGRSTGNHVHFEVRKNGRPVNPIGYLR